MKFVDGLIAEGHDSARRLEWMLLGWAVCGLVLFLLTKDLWLGNTDFPQVPLFAVGHFVPHWVDAICYVLVITCLVWTLATSPIIRRARSLASFSTSRSASAKGSPAKGSPAKGSPAKESPATESMAAESMAMGSSSRGSLGVRWPLALFSDALLVLVICNQHRLQPWAYLAWLTAIVVFFCKPRQAIGLLRILVIAIYLHSAIAKFDYEFVTTLGLSFLKPIKELVGLRMTWGTADSVLAGMFPMVELLVAAGLYMRRTRRLAIVAAVCMHVTLAVLLWRVLHHELPVVVWNIYFIWQVVVLFSRDASGNVNSITRWSERRRPEAEPAGSLASDLRAAGKPIAVGVIGAATLLPFLEPFGVCDHWPAWGLYAPRNSRCKLYVDEDNIEQLPVSWRDDARQHVDSEFGWTPGVEIELAWKSLQQLKAPIYPQDRFQLGVALGIVRKYELGDAATVVVESASDRISGQRDRVAYRGIDAIESAAARYWLNVEPRVSALETIDENAR